MLGIKISALDKDQVIAQVKSDLQNPTSYTQIVSLNPEIIMVARQDKKFAEILSKAAIQHIDGVGMLIAGKILGIKLPEKVAGVDLMEELLRTAGENNWRVLFLGGAPGVAEKLAEKYKREIRKIRGIRGIGEINKPESKEEENVATLVKDFQPQLVFVSFGSPSQEKWLESHRDLFCKSVVMGVGGAFDFLSGRVPRAPKIIRNLGLEWLFRLSLQPWRIKRQLSLIKFLWLVLTSRK